MKRIPFSQVLKNMGTDVQKEYDRLYRLFFLEKNDNYLNNGITLKEFCEENFTSFPYRKTCISLDDFEKTCGYHFVEDPLDFNLDYLVSFCEYSYNLICLIEQNSGAFRSSELNSALWFYTKQVERVVENIGYMANTQDCITDFVPKDQAAISVAEILIDPNLSYRVIEYNHHSMKGDLERKKAILVALGRKLEPKRGKLKQINDSLESNIFMLLNNMNVRHNNKEPGKKYKKYVAEMEDEELEQWHDDLYQMILLAFLELDHLDRKGRLEQLKENL